MKFELVEFYPAPEPKFKKNFLGTVHIYVIDCQLDIRGIIVNQFGKGMFFNFPYFKSVDAETGQDVRYPFIRWTNENTQKEMIDFLQQEVKPIIIQRLRGQG